MSKGVNEWMKVNKNITTSEKTFKAWTPVQLMLQFGVTNKTQVLLVCTHTESQWSVISMWASKL